MVFFIFYFLLILLYNNDGDNMDILISIKPEYTKLIEQNIKKYEFRTYLIKDIKTMYVYESNTSKLKYIMEIDKIIEYPETIEDNEINKLYNIGEYKYAYHIDHLYKLVKPITLTELKSKYKVYAPQKYTLLDNHKDLLSRLKKEDKIKIY